MTWIMNAGHSFRPLAAGMRIHDGDEELTVLKVSGSNATVKGKDGKTHQISTGSEVRRWVENGGNGGNGGQHHTSPASAPTPTLAPAPAPPAEPQAEAPPLPRPTSQVSLLSIAASADEDEDASELGEETSDGWEWSDPSTPSSIPAVEAAFASPAAEMQNTSISDPLVRGCLDRALHRYERAADRWHPLQQSGATDDQILTRIGAEFGSYGGGNFETGWYECRGGMRPEFSSWIYLDDEEGTKRVTCHLTGKALVAAVRELMEIPRGWYDPTAPEPADEPTTEHITAEPTTTEPTADTETPADEGADPTMSTNDLDEASEPNDPTPDSRATWSLSAITELTGIALPTLQRYFKASPRSFPHEGEGRARRFYPEAIGTFKDMRAGSKAGRPPSGGKGAATSAPSAAPVKTATATKKPASGATRAGAKNKAIPPARHITTEKGTPASTPIRTQQAPARMSSPSPITTITAGASARSDTAMNEAMWAMERASLLAKLEQTEEMLKMLEGEAKRLRKELGL